MATHAPELPERTHPLVWTVGLVAIIAILVGWFAHWFDTGRAHGRGKTIPVEKAAAAPIDHQKLIKDRSAAVLDKGEVVFSKNCSSCHGPTGQENPTGLTPPPRNFHKDAFMNANGGGPYGLYTVLENGFNGRMPAQPALSPEDKYAVIHFVRETWVKKDNASHYVENDSAEVAKKIPAPNAGGEGAAEVPPPRRPVEQPVLPLLAGIAAQGATDADAADAWLAAAAKGAGLAPAQARALAPLADHRGSGGVTTLYRAAKGGDAKAVLTQLSRPDGGTYVPGLAALPAGDATALAQHLITTASTARAAGAGAK